MTRRHDALIPLTHDHHHALKYAKRLESAVEASDPERQAAAEEFVAFFRDDAITHFREEEEVVFPLVADVDEATEPLQRVLMDHVQMHALVRRLEGQLEDGLTNPATMLAIAVKFQAHIRYEEKVLFPLIESLAGANLGSVALSPRDRSA